MKNKYARNSLGFSLIELLVVLSLIGITVFIIANILIFATRAQDLTNKEYYMQSDIRRTTEVTNELVRYSKAVFAVPESFVHSTDAMDPGWSYLMLSPDSKRIVIMEYDEILGKHIENTAVESSSGILYYVEFQKDEEAKGDTVLKYDIYAYNTDQNGNKTNERLVFKSTVEAVNAIQVEDKGTESDPSVALAFRNDGQTSGGGENQIAYVTIIVDASGSMNQRPDGGGSTYYETSNSRIYKVRKALIGNGSPEGTGIIQQFGKEENVFISYVPFSISANYPELFSNTEEDASHPVYEVYQSDDNTTLRSEIKKTTAAGYTNTGDALRRAYYLHENFRTTNSINTNDQVHHYIIMLVDGQTNRETSFYDWEDEGYYKKTNKIKTIYGIDYRRFKWITDWESTKNDNIIDGNIEIEYYLSAIKPGNDKRTRVDYYDDTISYKKNNGVWDDYIGKIEEFGEKNGDTTSNIIISGDNVSSIGQKIIDFNSGIKSYIIGYAKNLSTHVDGIGTSIGTDLDENIYNYDDPDFDLDEIFGNIATDIMADFWLAAGPQIMD